VVHLLRVIENLLADPVVVSREAGWVIRWKQRLYYMNMLPWRKMVELASQIAAAGLIDRTRDKLYALCYVVVGCRVGCRLCGEKESKQSVFDANRTT
jgi:hypothetical protein